MSRHTSNPSHGHRIKQSMEGYYIIYWCQDRYYAHNRLRHPVGYHRTVDEAGARRFCKKWGLERDPGPEEEGARDTMLHAGYIGLVLYGYCNGYFGRDAYEPKRIEGLGADWVVARGIETSVLFFASFSATGQKLTAELLTEWSIQA